MQWTIRNKGSVACEGADKGTVGREKERREAEEDKG